MHLRVRLGSGRPPHAYAPQGAPTCRCRHKAPTLPGAAPLTQASPPKTAAQPGKDTCLGPTMLRAALCSSRNDAARGGRFFRPSRARAGQGSGRARRVMGSAGNPCRERWFRCRGRRPARGLALRASAARASPPSPAPGLKLRTWLWAEPVGVLMGRGSGGKPGYLS